MARILQAQGNTVVGVEIDPQAAELARAACARVIVADIDTLELDELGGEAFDVILAGDVLEHLKDPTAVLARLSQALAGDGYIVATIPNVAHASVRLALLQGAFPYAELGLLDRTHLRFFTLPTLREMFEAAGFAIVYLHCLRKPLENAEVPFDAERVPAGVMDALKNDEEATVYQFVVVAVPIRAGNQPLVASHVGELLDRAQTADKDRDRAERAVAAREQELGAVHQRVAALERELAAAHQGVAGRLTVLAERLRESAVRERELSEQVRSAHLALHAHEERCAALEAALGDIEHQRAAVERERERIDSLLCATQAQAHAQHLLIETIRATRAWHTATRWYRLKRFVLGRY
jgi:SAM-dependent methyltransferase